MNELEIVINPYENTTRININNRPISPYSEISKYLKEPFYTWCDKILDSVSRELNDEFNLTIISRKSEAYILNGISQNYDDCKSLMHKDPAIDIPLSTRFETLDNLLSDFNLEIGTNKLHVNVFIYGSLQIDDIRNCFKDKQIEPDTREIYSYDKYPLCEVEIHIDKYCEKTYQNKVRESNYILVSNWNEATCVLNEIRKINEPCIIIVLNNNSTVQKIGNVFICGCARSEFIDIFYDLLEFRWITPMFINNLNWIKETLRDIASDKSDINEQIKLLSSIDPFITVHCAPQIEVNTFLPLIIKSYPDNVDIPRLNFKFSAERIISCSENNVLALSPGEVDVEVYIQGSLEPISKFHVNVIQRNKIEQIFLDRENYVMGVQDVLKLSYSFVPENADNQCMLQWLSSDDSIASVDSNGQVVAHKPGTCYIALKAEDISKSCLISVKSKISTIKLSETDVQLYVGQTCSINVEAYPSDTINNETCWETSDPNVIIYENGVIKAKGIGKATLNFFTTDRTVSSTCQVKVSSTFDKKDYHKGELITSVIAFILSIFLSGSNGINLLVPVLGAIFGFLAINKNKNDSGTATLFIILNLVIFILVFSGLFRL